MFNRLLPRVRPGDRPSASKWNELVDAIERSLRMHVGDGLEGGSGATGARIQATGRYDGFWGQITAVDSQGRFTWTELVPAPNGTWANGATGGPPGDPAYEVNGLTPSLPYNTRLYREANGSLYFGVDKCT